MTRLIAAFAPMVSVLVTGAPLLAQEVEPAQDFAISNTLVTLFHEGGHAAIDLFNLPVIGQEEDAADSFAVLEVLRNYDDASAESILTDSALAGLLIHYEDEAAGLLDYYDEHDLEAQRAYRSICYLYGTDPDAFAQAADWAEIPADRQDRCEDDAALAWDSWEGLIGDDLREELSGPSRVNLQWEASGTFSNAERVLRDSGIIEEAADILGRGYNWPQTITLRVLQCGEANAWYDPETREIGLCYEIVEDYLRLGRSLE